MGYIDEIKDRVSLIDVLQMYGQYPVKNFGGTNYRCFIHNDTSPSAGFTKSGDKFHCFSCGWTGSIFDIVQHFEKCDLKTAMKILDNKFELGVFRELSRKEKLELARKARERERERKEIMFWENYESLILADITKSLRDWEQVQKVAHITRGEYRNGTWELEDLFFHSLKKQKWLNWLYDAICGFEHEECEYDYIYPKDKRKLLEMIRKEEIVV